MRGFRQVARMARGDGLCRLSALRVRGRARCRDRRAVVTTAGYNNLRDDWDAGEPALTPAAVQSSSFGKVFSTKLDGAIYAQPLVFEGKVIVTTEKADAYAVDPSSGAVLWKRSFGKPFKAGTIGCSDLKPDLGSTSTPVIDPATGTVYMTTRLQVGRGIAGSHWYLQALSATNGEERPGFPVQISGTPYNTPGIPFNEGFEMQRPALLLLGGVVYVAFASNCDITPYRGIVAGFNAANGALTTMWSDESGVGTDENSEAGIWQSGGGLISDIPGRIILASGNGVSPSPVGVQRTTADAVGVGDGSHGRRRRADRSRASSLRRATHRRSTRTTRTSVPAVRSRCRRKRSAPKRTRISSSRTARTGASS